MSAGRSPDVVIVGGGLEGLSVAWRLTAAGVRDVLVLERDVLASGGTGKTSGVVRCHYGIQSLAAMALRGLDVLENAADVLAADVGFVRTGYLVAVGPADLEALAANVSMQRGLGIPVETPDSDTVRGMWPTAALGDFAGFAYEPRGGYGDGPQTALAYAAAAGRAGARIRQGSPVAALRAKDNRVTGVRLASGEVISCQTVVVAAGPWSVPLLAGVGVDLPIRSQREAVLLVDPGHPLMSGGVGSPAAREDHDRAALGPLGDVPVLSDLVCLQYVRRERSGELLVGNSDLSTPDWADPDRYLNRATEDELDSAGRKLAHRFPGLPEARLSSSYAGCYDVTPDYNPIIGPAGMDGLLVCAGFSGHGYKISPAVGQLVADLVLHGTSQDAAISASDFRLERFGEGKPLRSPHPYIGAGQMR
ncbi:MAG: NAD(P)/FAD-dependent oxidoreductase [Frankia sp.]